ncbi:threonine synthase-like 2 isoform X2 [Latimeria chalumnae]|uniref:Threonine synthase-like 2 n=1 Tax=Latimeria chalumnae TaxID=7897 RepID=H3ANZ3_LATCH|nr:PREDICTED: threonine synthase-like 2 isoform X1 [Latimeria chalumnae]|eukprot:XP_006007672.1 PREDICTED: threonine synthase-like 2 isoform X1 [Latimeria chalumnae]
MKYISTRGEASGIDFEETLFTGFAPDGGLYMPEEIPKLNVDTLRKWSTLSFTELVKEISSLFIPPEVILRKDLNDLVDRAFSRFQHKDIVCLSQLKNKLNVLELWHGMTRAFKDLALSCMGQLLQYVLKKSNKHVLILVVTSGDTGSSALEGVRGVDGVDIIVVLPYGRCTRIQELQMTTVIEDNVHVFAADGTCDDIDEHARKIFADTSFCRAHGLLSLNSANWSRILLQIPHFFYAYFRCVPSLNTTPLPEVEVVVPTGGAGNITAGCIAQKMGLPVRLVTVVNENDIIHRTIQHGDYSLASSVKQSLAPSIDIQQPYNMERIFWLLSGMDSNLMKEIMEEFYRSGKRKLPKNLHRKVLEVLMSCSVTDEDIVQTMKRCWEENQYLLCPHSAVAVVYHYQQSDQGNDCIPRCCLATASAVKFQDAVLSAGLVPEIPPDIAALEDKETRFTQMKRGEDWEKILRIKIQDITRARSVL